MAIQSAWRAHLVKSLWQYGIDQWIAQNEYIYCKTKEEQVERKIWKSINKSKHYIEQIYSGSKEWAGIYSLCLSKTARAVTGQETKMG